MCLPSPKYVTPSTQYQLQAITNQMMELSKETFAITPEIGKGIGKANAGMQNAKTNLTERNTSQAGKSQNFSIQGLNEIGRAHV